MKIEMNELTVEQLIEKLKSLDPKSKVYIIGQGLNEGCLITDFKIESIENYYRQWNIVEKELDSFLVNIKASRKDVIIH